MAYVLVRPFCHAIRLVAQYNEYTPRTDHDLSDLSTVDDLDDLVPHLPWREVMKDLPYRAGGMCC